MSKPHFEASIDTQKCCDYLKERNSATYAELSRFLDRDIAGKDRYVLVSARRRLERQGIVFITQTRVGVRRANDAQISNLATSEPIEKMKRVVRRSNKRERIVNVQALTADERAALYIGRAVIGAIHQSLRDAFRSAAAKVVKDQGGPISIKATLDLFKKIRVNGAE